MAITASLWAQGGVMGRRCCLFGGSTAFSLAWCYINHPGIASPAIEMLIHYIVNSNTDEHCEKRKK